MSANNKAKLKILYLNRILEEETDSEHGLTMPQIIERLNEVGINAERKGIYRDIDILREFGVDIQTYQRSSVEYALARRNFSLEELMLLVDTVESCKLLTSHQARMLTTNLKLMASDAQRDLLGRRIHVVGRIKSKNDSVFSYVDKIHQALQEKKKICFKYFHLGADGKKHYSFEGNSCEVTPVSISYDEGYYYLTAWVDEAEKLCEFRLDRMERLVISDEKATSRSEVTRFVHEGNEYEYFGRFDGERVSVTLSVNDKKTEIILDRFGSAAKIYPQKTGGAKAIVTVRVSPQFFGWIAGMDNMVCIEKPLRIKKAYRSYLKKLLGWENFC